ncbi:MAG: hypothetical protein AVDCRST_MAG68-3744, partial [uncultured Gemmatimonadetes bacterium]
DRLPQSPDARGGRRRGRSRAGAGRAGGDVGGRGAHRGDHPALPGVAHAEPRGLRGAHGGAGRRLEHPVRTGGGALPLAAPGARRRDLAGRAGAGPFRRSRAAGREPLRPDRVPGVLHPPARGQRLLPAQARRGRSHPGAPGALPGDAGLRRPGGGVAQRGLPPAGERGLRPGPLRRLGLPGGDGPPGARRGELPLQRLPHARPPVAAAGPRPHRGDGRRRAGRAPHRGEPHPHAGGRPPAPRAAPARQAGLVGQDLRI